MILNMPAVTVVVIIPGRPIVFIASFLRQFFADADATADSPTEPKHDDGHYNPCANDPLRIPRSTVISIGLDLEKQKKHSYVFFLCMPILCQIATVSGFKVLHGYSKGSNDGF